jgi:hypothetical protein
MRQNNFRFSKTDTTFKIIGKTTDMQDNTYILRFRDCLANEFSLLYSDFYNQIQIGKIVFAE